MNPKAALQLSKATVAAWVECKALRLRAALAFYTIFAITPMFVIALAIAGLWFGKEAARRELVGQVSSLLGKEGTIKCG